MYDLAIIASVHPQRAPLLARSLCTWKRNIEKLSQSVTVCLTTDGWDGRDLVKYALGDIPHQVQVTTEKSGSHITAYNHWTAAVEAHNYLYSHPDMLFPQGTLQAALANVMPKCWSTFKVFWLPQWMTAYLDYFPWMETERLEQYDELYRLDDKIKGRSYFNADVRAKTEWEATTTFVVDTDAAHQLYPFPDLHHQGVDDPLHWLMRQTLGIRTHVIMEPIIYHQFHEQLWDGDVELACKEAVEQHELWKKERGL